MNLGFAGRENLITAIDEEAERGCLLPWSQVRELERGNCAAATR
jgi:hypothetical protein